MTPMMMYSTVGLVCLPAAVAVWLSASSSPGQSLMDSGEVIAFLIRIKWTRILTPFSTRSTSDEDNKIVVE